jgi:hypothetical protein
MPRPVKNRDAYSDTIAFTGTSRGTTPGQQNQGREFLLQMFNIGYRRFRHGDCIGADAQFARIAKDLGYYLICHPGHPKDPSETKYRAFTDFNDEILDIRPFLDRDRDMVNESALLLAAPYQDYEVNRSGTWTTVRERIIVNARRMGKTNTANAMFQMAMNRHTYNLLTKRPTRWSRFRNFFRRMFSWLKK